MTKGKLHRTNSSTHRAKRKVDMYDGQFRGDPHKGGAWVARRLASHANNWSKITKDRWVLETVKGLPDIICVRTLSECDNYSAQSKSICLHPVSQHSAQFTSAGGQIPVQPRQMRSFRIGHTEGGLRIPHSV